MFDELNDGQSELPTADASTAGDCSGAFRPSRRKVLAVAAWTVPVVIVGTAAPALAASSSPVEFSWGTPCYHVSGAKSQTLHIPIRLTNTYNSEIKVQVTSVTVNGTLLNNIDQSRDEIDRNSTREIVVHAGKLDVQPSSVVIVLSYNVRANGQTTKYTVTSPSLPLSACASGIS